MKKRLKRIGNSLGITFSNEEKRIYGLVLGDIIELDEMLFEKKKEKKK